MINDGELRHYYGDGRSSSGASISADTWYHYCVTRTSGVVKGYINGTEVYSATHTTDIGGDTNHFLGAISTGGEPYNGEIDDIGFWNVGLPIGTDASTVNSVKWLYNGGTGRLANTITSGLKAYYNCDAISVTNSAKIFDLPENTIFEETDTRKYFFLQSDVWVEE